MQIAKLFAGLGFKVDTSGLIVFKKAIADARSEMTNITRGAKKATNQFRNLRRETDKLSSSMGKIKNAGGNKNVGGSYKALAGDVHKVNNAFNAIAANRSKTTKAIGKINAAVVAGTPHWNAYRRSIVQTRRTLQNLNGDLSRLRANSRIDVRIRNTGGNGGGGAGGSGGSGGFGLNDGLRAMLGSFLPSLAVSGVGGAVGYGAAKVVQASREQTRMESMILMTSKSAEEFAGTLDYVKTEAARLGLSSTELGKSFAQINMAAKGLDQGTKEEMFTGFSEFMMSMGTSQDDQKGIFRAFNQMFSNNRLLQEEINQLSERGIPATLVYDAAMKAYGTDNIQSIKKLQADGKLDPNRVLPVMAKMVQELAHDSGSYAKMMESSIVKQGKFYERLRQTSKQIMDSGLDVWLGKVFGQLEHLVGELAKVALSLKEIAKGMSDVKTGLDAVSGGNGGALGIILSLLLFRFKGLRLGAQRAFIVLKNGGKTTRALGELFKGVFGKSLKLIITRFGGWLTVIYGVYKGLALIGEQIKQRDLGNWTIFDTIALRTEYTILKVKSLIEELKWLQTYMTSGAVLNDSFDDISAGAANKVKTSIMPDMAKGVTQVFRAKGFYDDVVDKILNRESSAIKSVSEYEDRVNVGKSISSGDTINIYSNKTGELIESHKVPPTYNR